MDIPTGLPSAACLPLYSPNLSSAMQANHLSHHHVFLRKTKNGEKKNGKKQGQAQLESYLQPSDKSAVYVQRERTSSFVL